MIDEATQAGLNFSNEHL